MSRQTWIDASPPTAKAEQRGRSQSESLLFTMTNRGSCSTVWDKEKACKIPLFSSAAISSNDQAQKANAHYDLDICFLFTHFNYVSFMAGIDNSMLLKVKVKKINQTK